MQETKNFTIPEAIAFGIELMTSGRYEDASGLFRGVLAHEPANFDAVEKLGSCLFEIGRHHEALYWFWRGRKIDRRHPTALVNYGLCVAQLGHWEEGLVEIEKAIAQAKKREISAPAMAMLYNNLGNTLERLRRYQEALDALDKGIACNPNDAFPHYNRGVVLLRLNRQREAIAALDRSLELQPGSADALYNRSMGKLILGDLAGGFADYEARLTASDNKIPNFGLPPAKKWTGTAPIEGKTVLVYCEQGLGDDIQFLRFLPALVAAEKIKIVTHGATRSLLPELTNLEVLEPGAELGHYDHWTALMSLPHCLGITDERQIPPPLFIPVANERGELWRLRLAKASVLRVGVCWSGNWQHKNDHNRSIELGDFAAIFDTPKCSFFALHHLRPGEQEHFEAIKARYHDDRLTHIAFDDFRDTAAAILNLDLVVTVDTSIAHLSASLGVPTWILLPQIGTDWRWQIERKDSPWYPAAKLFRQIKAGNWTSTLAGLRQELAAYAALQAAA